MGVASSVGSVHVKEYYTSATLLKECKKYTYSMQVAYFVFLWHSSKLVLKVYFKCHLEIRSDVHNPELPLYGILDMVTSKLMD